MIRGMNNQSGKGIKGERHLGQSIRDILTTPTGSRVMRREYGSLLFDLVDQPANDTARLRMIAVAAHALIRWEPRLGLKKIDIQTDFSGKVTLEVQGQVKGENVFFNLPLETFGPSRLNESEGS